MSAQAQLAPPMPHAALRSGRNRSGAYSVARDPARMPPPRPVPLASASSTEWSTASTEWSTRATNDSESRIATHENVPWPQPTYAGNGHLFLFMR